ncbi:hypothetical protein [Rhodococcus pyridinivorans]
MSKPAGAQMRPPALIQGYIRALTVENDTFAQLLDPTALYAALGHPSGIEELWRRDAERWTTALTADGLPKARVLVIQHAAEGLAVARSSPYLTEEDLALARAELLAMTEQP